MKTKKNKKAIAFSFIIHAVILTAALFPLISMISKENKDDFEGLHFIEIAFESGDMSPSSASTKKEELIEENLIEAEKKDKVEKEQRTDEKVAEKNEVIDTRNESDVSMKEGKQYETANDVVDEESSEENTNEGGGNTESDSKAGEGKVGESITGKALADMDFEGEGVFGRKIIYFANISKLAEKEGRVVVNLCINKSGRVTHIAFNRGESTLDDSKYIKQVMSVASKYKFEKDYNAPDAQCGKLTFIFKIG